MTLWGIARPRRARRASTIDYRNRGHRVAPAQARHDQLARHVDDDHALPQGSLLPRALGRLRGPGARASTAELTVPAHHTTERGTLAFGMRRALLATLLWALAAPALAHAQGPAPAPPPMPGSFELLGHDPLLMRGMNAALAVHGGYAYVGNRTDGTHANPGVFVVDVRDPAKPAIVKEIGAPDEGLPTQSSRELRILPDQKLLLVLNHQCSEAIHRCAGAVERRRQRAAEQLQVLRHRGRERRRPQARRRPTSRRPRRRRRHRTSSSSGTTPSARVACSCTRRRRGSGVDGTEITVTDLSRAREGVFPEIAGLQRRGAGGSAHSLTVSNDGTRDVPRRSSPAASWSPTRPRSPTVAIEPQDPAAHTARTTRRRGPDPARTPRSRSPVATAT